MHAIALVPPYHRMKVPLDVHLNEQQALYAQGDLMRLHSVYIDRTAEKATDYAFKSVARHTVDYDDIIILPRTQNEMPGKE